MRSHPDNDDPDNDNDLPTMMTDPDQTSELVLYPVPALQFPGRIESELKVFAAGRRRDARADADARGGVRSVRAGAHSETKAHLWTAPQDPFGRPAFVGVRQHGRFAQLRECLVVGVDSDAFIPMDLFVGLSRPAAGGTASRSKTEQDGEGCDGQQGFHRHHRVVPRSDPVDRRIGCLELSVKLLAVRVTFSGYMNPGISVD